MEKEQPDSMTTVAIKPEYPPSEYSASEPPPAYRRPMSSAVQIARIAAYTIVASSFILGTFILASSWVQARAGCQQLEQLDAMLDKELALEGRAYGNDALVADEPLPIGSAHALHGAPPTSPPPAPTAAPFAPLEKKSAPAPVAASHTDDVLNRAESKINEDKLQKLDDDKDDSPTEDSSDEADSDSDEDDLDGGRGPMLRLPIQFDLDDLAGAFLANNNQKGRMNCVVERRREELIEKRFPFNLLGAFGPKQEPSERIAIICHGGDDKPEFPEPAAQVFAFPLSGPPRMPLRPLPPAGLQPPAPAQPMHRAAPFPMHMPWDSNEENSPPREMRIHVQRIIAIPSRNMPGPPEHNMIPFSRQNEGPFPHDMRPNDFPFHRPHEMIFPRDMPLPRPQEIPSNRPMDMPFHRPQEMPMHPHDMPMRPQEMPMRPQEMPMRPHDMPMRPQDNPPRPQDMLIRPHDIPMPPQEQRHHILIAPSFPRQNTNPFPDQQQPSQQTQGEQNESTVMHQFVPQPQQPIQEIENPEKVELDSMGIPMALPWGLTPETLRAIHRHAIEADRQQEESDVEQQQMDSDMQEVKTIVNTLAAAAAAEVEGAVSRAQAQDNTSAQSPDHTQVHLDAPALIQHEEPAPEERPHYVQPRSVRSVDALLHREKRVKRCACDCV